MLESAVFASAQRGAPPQHAQRARVTVSSARCAGGGAGPIGAGARGAGRGDRADRPAPRAPRAAGRRRGLLAVPAGAARRALRWAWIGAALLGTGRRGAPAKRRRSWVSDGVARLLKTRRKLLAARDRCGRTGAAGAARRFGVARRRCCPRCRPGLRSRSSPGVCDCRCPAPVARPRCRLLELTVLTGLAVDAGRRRCRAARPEPLAGLAPQHRRPAAGPLQLRDAGLRRTVPRLCVASARQRGAGRRGLSARLSACGRWAAGRVGTSAWLAGRRPLVAGAPVGRCA